MTTSDGDFGRLGLGRYSNEVALQVPLTKAKITANIAICTIIQPFFLGAGCQGFIFTLWSWGKPHQSTITAIILSFPDEKTNFVAAYSDVFVRVRSSPWVSVGLRFEENTRILKSSPLFILFCFLAQSVYASLGSGPGSEIHISTRHIPAPNKPSLPSEGI